MPSPTIFSFTLEDAKGSRATSMYYVAYNAAIETVGSVLGATAALGALLDAITDAKIVDARVIIDMAPDPGWKQAAVANCDVEESEIFDFTQANSKYLQSVVVPAIKQSLLIGGGRVDLTGAGPIKSFVQELLDDIGGSNAYFANSKYSNDLVTIKQAYKSPRRHAKAAKQRTLSTP